MPGDETPVRDRFLPPFAPYLGDEEYQEGIRCVASWIVDFEGRVVASIGLSAPKARMSRARVTELGRAVRDAAGEISARLGAPGGDAVCR